MPSFSRTNRLITKQDYQSVFAHPKKSSYKHFLALFCVNNKDHARLGMIIGKQHLKLAVDRNVVRRLIRESFRMHKETLKGLDIIVLLRSKCSTLDKNALRDDIDKLWLSVQPHAKESPLAE